MCFLMGPGLSRRRFLALSLLGLVLPRSAVGDGPERTHRTYEANIGVLFDLLTFTLTGSVIQEIDRGAGSYRVTMNGKGPGVTAQIESRGIIRSGRFMPTQTRSSHTVRGHDNSLAVTYDYERRIVEYHVLAYTFLLGRRWQVDDLVMLPPGLHIDDVISALLNFGVNALDEDPDGSYRVTVVRRARPANEGPDDVSPRYRAELATTHFRVTTDPKTGQQTALVDLTGFSSWARPSRPALVVFAPDRSLESVKTSLILGTTFTLRVSPVA